MTSSQRAFTCLEPLENRIAPAVGAVFTEADGDEVTVFTDAPVSGADLLARLTINAGELEVVDLTGGAFQGRNVTITVTGGSGDGFAAVDLIDASGSDLGKVEVGGRLSQILAGDADASTTGVKSLVVDEMIADLPGGGATGPTSAIVGKLGKLRVAGDMVGVGISAAALPDVRVGGSVIGANDGIGFTADRIGEMRIGGNLEGGNANTARIVAAGSIGSIVIGGGVIGSGMDSACIVAGASIGSIAIGASLVGADDGSARIECDGDFGSLKVHGQISAGGVGTACVIVGSDLGTLKVNAVKPDGTAFAIAIQGAQDDSARFEIAGRIGKFVAKGDFTGGSEDSAVLLAESAGVVRVDGVLKGGGTGSSQILIGADVDSLRIDGGLNGGAANTARISVGGQVETLRVGTMVGASQDSVTINASRVVEMIVDGDIRGGSGDSALISIDLIDRLDIRGSVISGAPNSAVIGAKDGIGSMLIRGDLGNGGAPVSAYVTVTLGSIGKLEIEGSILVGGGGATAVSADGRIKTLVVGGSITGDSATLPALVTAGGNGIGTKTAIGKVSVAGDVTHAFFGAGYSGIVLENGDASIGKILVGGDWAGSTAVAGVARADDGLFGTDDDKVISGGIPEILGTIGLIRIGGTASGTSGTGDHFGIVAEQISKVQIGGITLPLQAGPGNDTGAGALEIGPHADFFVREVA